VRVLVDMPSECYSALGLVHSRWAPVAGRIKDYIAQPKLNGYQSLHTTVYADAKPLEIQIRTRQMHRDAEYGVAAHFEYKEHPSGPAAAAKLRARQHRASFVEGLSGSAESERDPELFYRDLLDHLAGEDEVYVYTPRGDVKVLPQGSTPIDFAYAIHTEVGDRCVGARINGRQVPFAYQLRSGDHVEVITREGSTPSRDWLRLAASPRAKHKIRAFHAHSDRAEQEDAGRRALDQAVRRSHLDMTAITGPELVAVVSEMGYRQASDFYVALGTGNLAAQAVVRHLGRRLPAPVRIPRLRSRQKSDALVDSAGEALGVAWQLARCCSPIPGDDVIAHVHSGRALVVHRRRCPQLASRKAPAQSLMEVAWAHQPGSAGAARIVVQGDNRPGLLEAVSSQIAQAGGNIMRHAGTSGEGASSLTLTVELQGTQALDRMLAAIRSVGGVFDAWRADA
jgi:guanosine-3',5'-bis(diphosphate) 3'-pyrophosphohydrolase